MTKKIKDRLRAGSNRTFLARDFDAFRAQLIEHARIFFPDKIQDFSEPSLGGLLVDLAATVGDTMSFYLDHQFRELDPARAVEFENITTHLRNAGVKISGSAPASALVTFSIIVPSESFVDVSTGQTMQRPKQSALPIILADSILESSNGITFNPVEDIDFSETTVTGLLVAEKEPNTFDDGVVSSWKLSRKVNVVSGTETVETFTIPDEHEPFREITLGNPNVTEILSIFDSENNEYYEVESLSQDTVFETVTNENKADLERVPKTLEIRHAPRRFVSTVSPANFRTTVRFGSGNSQALDDDIAPDPSELALSMFGKNTFSRFSIDPNSLIDTQTLGISPRATTLTVTYRHGGGLRHNVGSGLINTVSFLSLEFRKNPTPTDALSVRLSTEVINPRAATGGANTPDTDFLRGLIGPARNAQSRIVTKEDLIARIYTLPAKFGRVFRVGLSENTQAGSSLKVHIISQDSEGNLTVSPDTLKQNLSTYLNEFRMISDSIDVLDAKVLNYQIRYEVVLSRKVNKQSTLLAVNRAIAESVEIKYFQIDQPIIIDDIINVIINTPGVISISDFEIKPITGVEVSSGDVFGKGAGDRIYSVHSFQTEGSVKKGVLRGDIGSIFELRYPENDITGHAV